jgi:hypothetical protein
MTTEVRDDSFHTEWLAQFFAYTHLPPHLQPISEMFYLAAVGLCKAVPKNPERTVALRKLLEAKDCAVRARVSAD